MDKIIGNYTRQTEFPLDEETLVALQGNQALVELLGNIAGDKTILYGCGLYNSNTMRYAGYVFAKTTEFPTGEILRFEGGSVSAGMYLKKTAIDVNANNVKYAGAYTQRSLAPGLGDETFQWSDFKTLHTNAELKALCDNLQAQIALLTPPPLGIVQLWAGTESNIPSGYALCDGRQLNRTTYAKLFAVIGTQFNTAKSWNGNTQTTSPEMFRLPDLRGRFVVGKNESANESEYATIGNTGGEKKHTLTESEMPSHTHTASTQSAGGHTHTATPSTTYKGSASGKYLNFQTGNSNTNSGFSVSISSAGAHTHTMTVGSVGSGAAHENRPPYYVLAYIMRIQ